MKKSEKSRVHSILNGKEGEMRSKEVDCINVEFSCGMCIHGEYYLCLLMGLNLFLSLSLQTSSAPKPFSQPLQKKAPKHRPFSVLPVFSILDATSVTSVRPSLSEHMSA